MSESIEDAVRRYVEEMRKNRPPSKQVRYDRPPDHVGSHGEAWLINAPGDSTTTCARRVLRCEWAHPMWEYWLVSSVHLRDVPDHRPATLQFPGATHEVLIAALNPDHPLPTGAGTARLLQPLDVVQHVTLDDDSQAVDLTKLVVEACCAGRMSPDSDFRRAWETVLTSTAAHLRGEHDS